MSDNRAFWKTLHSLTHPVTMVAILLLLFNDHWLRHQYPSWLTGKLGDFTWLVFMPFLVALVLAFIIPKTSSKQTQFVGIAALVITGVWFASVKTIPIVHDVMLETLYALMGYRGSFRMDVTDLMTLPALLVSWVVWRDAKACALQLKPVVYVMLGLGILGTLASDEPQYRVTAIEWICALPDGRLSTSYEDNTADWNAEPFTFISEDGGYTWNYAPDAPAHPLTKPAADVVCSSTQVTTAQHPTDNRLQYQWERGQYIERSRDGGITWERVHGLPELRQDVREYGNHNPHITSYDWEPPYRDSPVSGLVHGYTGNLVLAMSSDGVLLIEPDGTSEWVAVGNYRIDTLSRVTFMREALSVQFFLLPTLWFLILVSTIALIHSRRLLTRIWLALGWASWVILVIMGHNIFDALDAYAPNTNYAFLWGLQAFGSLVLIGIPMTLWALRLLARYYGKVSPKIIVTVLLTSGAYLLPFLMWSQGTIARYYLAAIFALMLTACVLAACYSRYKERLPMRHEPEKAKRKQKNKNSVQA